MSDSATNPDALAPRSVALVHPPEELTLEPLEGLARWLGRTLHRFVFRFVSMVEQPLATMSGPLSPVEGYFRRDRHRHPRVDPQTYRLEVSGVASPRSFTLDELRALPQEERVLVMECAGNGNHLMGSAGLVGQARWTGPSLATVLEACGGPGPATHFAFHGLDPIPVVRRGYHYGLSLPELTQARALLALEMNGEPLPRPRGFPLRMVVPGIYSMSHVKWLGHIEGKTAPHMGIHNRLVFTNKERRNGRWVRVQARWIGLKSMVTRCQRIDGGWRLTGWAWGGSEPIDRVEITTDGGKTWHQAQLHAPGEYFGEDMPPESFEHAWSVFDFRWRNPAPGRHVVGSRAHARGGAVQALEQDPSVKGHFNQTRVKWRRVDVPE
ncbi:molybdopterin-dependent oxidoreductase [Paraliomyxa miuraensis]|uniref:molybdopterin-dependent oxidoreductase n=1 Tax=Paraliomyxa miuraensis TaxID=376150 RepID=UPI00225430D1|nr:molybdopterin-dependent oxidoreductase [Paraliomyxa miuraensis]MCX4243803.1 molybdopterin-dependent oxidoreductase [Paraliomyxa miuraensis]